MDKDKVQDGDSTPCLGQDRADSTWTVAFSSKTAFRFNANLLPPFCGRESLKMPSVCRGGCISSVPLVAENRD